VTTAGSLDIRIRINAEELTRGLQRASAQVASATKRMGEQFTRLGQDMARLGGDFTAKLTAPIGILGTVMVKTAGDFEAAMINLRVLAAEGGATAAQLASLEEVARRLGSTTQFSASQVADAMYQMVQGGLSAAEAVEGVSSALDLAGASGMGIADSANLLAKVMGSQRMGAEELTHAVDVLTKASLDSQTDLQSLGEAFKQAGPITKTAGVEFETATAILAEMSRAGYESSRAGNALKRAMSQLAGAAKPGETAGNATGRALRKLGVEAKDAEGNIRPLVDILDDMVAAGADLGDFTTAFDTFAAGPMIDLSTRTDAIRQMTETLNSVEGVARKVNAAKMTGFNGQLEQMSGAFQELAIAIGQSGVLASLTQFVSNVAKWLEGLSKTNPQLLAMAAAAAGLAAAIGPLLIAMGAVVWSIGQLATAAGVVMGVLAGPAGLVALLGVALVAALGLASTRTVEHHAALLKLGQLQSRLVGLSTEYVTASEDRAEAIRKERDEVLNLMEAEIARARQAVAKEMANPWNHPRSGKPRAVQQAEADIAAQEEALRKLRKDWARAEMERQKTQAAPVAPAIAGGGPALNTSGYTEETLDARKALADQVRELEALAAAGQVSAEAMERLRIEQDILASGWQGSKAELAAYVDRIVEANSVLDAAQGLERELARMGEARIAYADAIEDRRALIAAMAEGEEAYEREIIRQQLVADGLGDVNRRLEEQIALRKQEKDAADDAAFWSDMANAPIDAIKSGLARGETGLKDVIADFGDRLRMVLLEELVFDPLDELARQMAVGLKKAFGDAMKGMNTGGTGPGGFWGGVIQAVGSLFAPRAIGGPTLSGQPYLVGEKGPELFIPSGTGTVEPLRNLGGGRGGTSMTFSPVLNFNGGEVSRADLDAALAQAQAQFAASFNPMFDQRLADRRRHGESFSPRTR
jgi:TP901 family phage tail tape measure protein